MSIIKSTKHLISEKLLQKRYYLILCTTSKTHNEEVFCPCFVVLGFLACFLCLFNNININNSNLIIALGMKKLYNNNNDRDNKTFM